RLIDREDETRAGRIGAVGVGGDLVALDARVAVRVRVVHEEPAVRPVPGMEGQAEQALFATGRHLCAQVEEWRREQGAVADDADRARLFYNEEAVVTDGCRQVERRCEPFGDELELRLVARRRW